MGVLGIDGTAVGAGYAEKGLTATVTVFVRSRIAHSTLAAKHNARPLRTSLHSQSILAVAPLLIEHFSQEEKTVNKRVEDRARFAISIRQVCNFSTEMSTEIYHFGLPF
jgi:hypothetical protein